MPRKATEKPLKSKQFGEAIQKRVKELGSNPAKLAVAIDRAYNSIRMVYNGEEFPGPQLLYKLCNYLELNYDEMKILIEHDKALSKNTIPIEMLDGEFLEFYELFSQLEEKDKDEIMKNVKQKKIKSQVN